MMRVPLAELLPGENKCGVNGPEIHTVQGVFYKKLIRLRGI